MNAHDLPTEWQLMQLPERCLAGALWQSVHFAFELGCENDHFRVLEWHFEHSPERCLAGAA